MGSSLLALFVNAGLAGPLGFWTIFVAHVMFCLSFVVVTVKARLDRPGPAPGAGRGRPVRQRVADVLAGQLPAGLPRHPGGGAAQLLAVLRRLHHHQPQRRASGDLPDVRLGGRPAGHPDADQRDRHADVPGGDGGRARRRARSAAAEGPVTPDPHVVRRAREALAGAAPSVFWLDDPRRPDPEPAAPGDGEADLVVVGGGYTGLWTALLARERRPGSVRHPAGGGTVRVGGVGAQRRLRLGEPDPRFLERARAVARGGRAAGPARRREPGRDRPDGPRPRHRLRLGADRGADRRDAAARGRRAADAGGRDGRRRLRGRAAGRRAGARRGRLPDVPRGAAGAARHRAGGAGPAGVGPASRVPGRRRPDPRADPGDRPGALGRGRCG